MKTFLCATLLIVSSLSLSYAQKPINITDDSYKFGNSMCDGIWVDIPEVELKSVQSNWKKLIEKGTKSKALVTDNEITIFGAQLSDIYASPINIFSAIDTKDTTLRLFVAAELSRDEFAAVNSEEYEQLKKMVKQFAKDQYIKVAKDQLSSQESALKSLQKELSSAKKDKDKLEKEIQSANTSISEETYKIASVQKDLASTDASIESVSSGLNGMSDGDAKKQAESELKSLQKKKKEDEKSLTTSENKIVKAKNVIEENTTAISENIKKQEEITGKIDKQTLVVSKYTNKLQTIENY